MTKPTIKEGDRVRLLPHDKEKEDEMNNAICAIGIKRDEYARVFGEHADWLYAKVRAFVNDYSFNERFECADNFRVANMSDPAQVQDLEERHWCCGSGCQTFRHEDGTVYRLAFDYGH